MEERDRLCCLTLDEMEISAATEYDASSKSVLGDVTIPGHDGQATHALVVMLGGTSFVVLFTDIILTRNIDLTQYRKVARHTRSLSQQVVANHNHRSYCPNGKLVAITVLHRKQQFYPAVRVSRTSIYMCIHTCMWHLPSACYFSY